MYTMITTSFQNGFPKILPAEGDLIAFPNFGVRNEGTVNSDDNFKLLRISLGEDLKETMYVNAAEVVS